jgi:phosphopantothenoylcysteine decarboxylase/phosphopantothenate--cysteine ligase
MDAKGADLIVVNDVGREDIGFDAAQNEVVILGRDGLREHVSRRGKREVAEKILDALREARTPQALSASTVHLSENQPK